MMWRLLGGWAMLSLDSIFLSAKSPTLRILGSRSKRSLILCWSSVRTVQQCYRVANSFPPRSFLTRPIKETHHVITSHLSGEERYFPQIMLLSQAKFKSGKKYLGKLSGREGRIPMIMKKPSRISLPNHELNCTSFELEHYRFKRKCKERCSQMTLSMNHR